MTNTRIPAERLAAGLVFLIGCAAIYGSVQLGIGSLTSPEPGFFPLLAALLLTALSAIVFIQDLSGAAVEAAQGEPESSMRPALMAIAALAIYVFVLGWLGYLPATALLVVALLAIFDVRRVLAYVIAVPLIAGGSYVLFGILLNLQLPTGSLGI